MNQKKLRSMSAIAVAVMAMLALTLGLAAPPAPNDSGQVAYTISFDSSGVAANNSATVPIDTTVVITAIASNEAGTVTSLDTSPQETTVANTIQATIMSALNTSPPAAPAVNNNANQNSTAQNTLAQNSSTNAINETTATNDANNNSDSTADATTATLTNERCSLGNDPAVNGQNVAHNEIANRATVNLEGVNCFGAYLATTSLNTAIQSSTSG